VRIVARYRAAINKHDGEGWQRLRHQRADGSWSYSLTYLEVRKLRRRAKREGWSFKSFLIKKVSSKPPKQVAAQYPNDTHVTPHFTWAEFACKDGTPVPAEYRSRVVKLAWGLEQLRTHLGGPVHILSGYRTPAYNTLIGGASQSQHVQARAADLVVSPWGQDRLVAAAERVDVFYNGGIGVYPSGGVHVDVRGYKARWTSF
jgi:hypothetical protein